jgi:hypothetical protein
LVRKTACLMLAILSVMAHTYVSAQKTELDTLTKKFDQYRTKYATEKIYAQLDQELYLTGEILWVKLYLVDGSVHKPSGISKVAYIEILDKTNRPVLQSKVALKDGYGNGSLYLPAGIDGGNYTFRAYTSWMKNFSPDFYFHSTITIINTFKKLEIEKKAVAQKPDAQFFPEGGNLVNGLRSKVAFRVIDQQAHGIDFKGFVLDQNNDTITTFAPKKFGMGSFFLTPVQGKEYRAVIDDGHGQRGLFKLPASLESGYVMSVVDSTENELAINIHSQLKEAPTVPVVYVFIHSRNITSTASMHFMQQGKTTVLVPKKNLQEGISHITLFDADLHPVCERLCFIPLKNKLEVDLKSSQREFGIRRKVSIDINVQSSDKKPQSSNLSVAVYRADSLVKTPEFDITSYFWLVSDLKGSIESPEYFLDQNDPEVRSNVDNLMLTHGWRRFVWKDILTKPSVNIAFVPEYRGHIIRGRVTRDGQPANGVLTYISAPGRNIQVYGSISDTEGRVQYEMKDFGGPKRVIAQTNMTRDSISNIEILSPFSDEYLNRVMPPFKLSSTLEQQVIARSISMQVQDVFFQDRSNKFKTPTNDTTAFYGKADATYYLDDYTRFPVMEEILREYVPGVMVRKRRDGFHFILLDQVNKGIFDADPLILLDGIPVFDVDKIMAFDPLKVKKLEVLTRRYYMGALSLPGVVSFTTYAGDLGGFQLDPRSVQLDYEGLQLQREFYSPLYETSKQRESRLPDQRSLLFWAPVVITGKDGKQHLDFFTSDVVGDYHVVVEGMTKEGLSGGGTTMFSVRPYDN